MGLFLLFDSRGQTERAGGGGGGGVFVTLNCTCNTSH